MNTKHITYTIQRGVSFLERSIAGSFFKLIARWRIHREFRHSNFVGPYEKNGAYMGFREEQWLWSHRDWIRGQVLDMSTPRFWHEWIYHLPNVSRVLISDYWEGEVQKWKGPPSKADIVGDFAAQELPVPEASFDTVLCLNVLEHCEDPVAMIKNIGRILRPGGIVFFLSPFAYVDGHTGPTGPDFWRFARDGYILMARKTGLQVLETGRHGDLGGYGLFELGESMAATHWHRGVPLANWMICRRPKLE